MEEAGYMVRAARHEAYGNTKEGLAVDYTLKGMMALGLKPAWEVTHVSSQVIPLIPTALY